MGVLSEEAKSQLENSFEPIKRSTIDVKEAAAYIGISKDLMYQLCREKRIPHFRIGARILLKRDKLDDWMEQMMESSVIDEK